LRIIRYLDGEMSGEELKAFEDEVRMNQPLKEELDRYRQIQDLAEKLLSDQGGESGNLSTGSDSEGEKESAEPGPRVEQEIREAVREFKSDPASYGDIPGEYRDELAGAGDAFFANRHRSGSLRLIRRIWYSAAAVVVLALTISILILKPFKKMTPGEIYSEYFTTFHKTEQIEEIARNDNDFLFATRVYEAGDFERASVLFGMLADSSQVRAWALFYEGCSYMALNQPEKAAGIFQTVLDEGDGEVLSDAKWQLALCYIRLSRPEKATDLLMSLREDPAYRKDAGKILRILR